MKFMVMSNPLAPRPAVAGKTPFWTWVEGQKANGTVEAVYVRVSRGTILVVNVDSHETLHRFISEWSNNVLAQFEVIPLIERPPVVGATQT